jgi:hypothetical protein
VLQFDLEQQIMNCWGVVDDIQGLLKLEDLRSMTEDEHQNYLLGLATIYQVKFELLQNLFERFMAEHYAAQPSRKEPDSQIELNLATWPFPELDLDPGENPSY